MAITFNELDHPRESGKFIDKEQSSPETTLVPQSATSREASVRERLMGMGDMSPLNYGPMEHGFDRNFHANPDSARLAELASTPLDPSRCTLHSLQTAILLPFGVSLIGDQVFGLRLAAHPRVALHTISSDAE